MTEPKLWLSTEGPPPVFTSLSNGIIEYLLDRNYQIVAYWHNYRDNKLVSIDIIDDPVISAESRGCVGRVECPIKSTIVHLCVIGKSRKSLDAADPIFFDQLEDYFTTVFDHHDLSNSAPKQLA